MASPAVTSATTYSLHAAVARERESALLLKFAFTPQTPPLEPSKQEPVAPSTLREVIERWLNQAL
jgi:hypothetical protein